MRVVCSWSLFGKCLLVSSLFYPDNDLRHS